MFFIPLYISYIYPCLFLLSAKLLSIVYFLRSDKTFCSFEDLKNRLKYWKKEYNNFLMKSLGWKSPNEKYIEYIKG